MADGAGMTLMAQLPVRKQCERRRLMLNAERTSWIDHWRDINRMVSPRMGRFIGDKVNDGKKKHNNIYDGSATYSSRVLSAGMMAGLTSPARPWVKLTTPDPDLAEFGSVKQWLHVVTQRMLTVFTKSNLYNVLPTIYRELGDYGTACLFGQEDQREILRFFPFTIGSYALATNDRLMVDTVYREFKMTAAQIVGRWGKDKASEAVRSAYDRGNLDQWFDVVHAIEPNLNRERGKKDNRNLPYRSVYYEMNRQCLEGEDGILGVSGYYEFPAMAPRWDVTGEDVYGNGPGMDALGDVKSLQHEQKRKAELIDKLASPPMTGPTSLRNSPASLLPSDITYVDVISGQGGFQPVYVPAPQAVVAVKDDILELQMRIKRAYYEDLFLMLANDTRSNITAREVQERHEEKLLMLGPVLERLNDELLDPLVDRTFNAMLRAGMIPEPPPELENMELEVEYISVLAQAQKSVAVGGIERFMAFTGSIAAMNPAALDKVDFDQTIDEYADAMGIPPRMIRSDDDVAADRDAKAQQQQATQAAAMGAAAADAAQKLANTPMDQDSALTRALGVAP